MTIDDQIRKSMRAHDAEAPTDVPWPPADEAAASPRRLMRPVLVAATTLAAAAVAAAAVTLVGANGPTQQDSAPSTGPAVRCPSTWASPTSGQPLTVPARPTTGQTGDRLIPERTPDQVLVCSYVPTQSNEDSEATQGSTTVSLSGHTMLSGNLSPVAAALSDLPRATTEPAACAAYRGPHDGHGYLLALTYGDQTVWVAAPGDHCSGATNGIFTTSTNLQTTVAAWLTTGSADVAASSPPPPSGTDAAACNAAGRLGQDTAMVPGDPSTVVVCVDQGTSADTRIVTFPPGQIDALTSALNALPTRTSEHGCTPQTPTANPTAAPSNQASPFYTLVFNYPSGPAVKVTINAGCAPPVDNGSLQATTTGAVLPQIEAAVG